MSNSNQNPPIEPGDLSEDFALGYECALPPLPVTYLFVGRGALPQAAPGETYVRCKFDPTKTPSP